MDLITDSNRIVFQDRMHMIELSNIIYIESVGRKSEEYEDLYLDAETHHHLVKIANYVILEGSDSTTALTSSKLQYSGAYEYAPAVWIAERIHFRAVQWYLILNGKAVTKVGAEERDAQEEAVTFVPRNTVHSCRIVGDGPIRILNVGTWFSGEPSVTKLVSQTKS